MDTCIGYRDCAYSWVTYYLQNGQNISGSELAGRKSYSSTLERRAGRKENLQCVVRKPLTCFLGRRGGKGFAELQGLIVHSPEEW